MTRSKTLVVIAAWPPKVLTLMEPPLSRSLIVISRFSNRRLG